MRLLLVLFISVFIVQGLKAEVRQQNEAREGLSHEVKSQETVWFLAELYYGSPKRFQDILNANNFKAPEDVIAGQELLIPNPNFSDKDPGFKKRYEKIKLSKANKVFARVKVSKKVAKSELASSGVVNSVVVKKAARKPASQGDQQEAFALEEVSVKKTPAQSAKDELQSH